MKKINRPKPSNNILQYNSAWRIKNWNNNKSQKEKLQNELGKMSDFRCSYCDIKNVKKGIHQGNIEHFLPKSEFPNFSNVWHNLFWVCGDCNQIFKGTKYIEKNEKIKPLKPDLENTCTTDEYNFNKWFRIDFSTGELISLKSNKNWKRAEWTIKLFGLNHENRTTARQNTLDNYRLNLEFGLPYTNKKMHLRNFSYSFYIEEWLKINKHKFEY